MHGGPDHRGVTDGGSARLRWLGIAIAIASAGAFSVGVALAGLFEGEVDLEMLAISLLVLGMLVVGGLLAVRVPRNAVGWLVLATGSLWSLQALSEGYARYSVAGAPGAAPGATVALWFASWSWIGGIALLPAFGLLVFPAGRLPSRAWRPVLWAAVAGLALVLMAQWTVRWGPDAYHFSFALEARNPLHVPALEPLRFGAAALGVGLLGVGVVGSVAAAIVRFRRSRGDERRQLKWVVFGVTAALGLYLLALGLLQLLAVLDALPRYRLEGFFLAFALGAFPVTVAIAVLRFRLYDIDRIISRTVAYAAVVTILAAVYVGLVVGLQALLSPVTSGSELTVAGSTLAVAALFGPVRRRVRSIVDRHFDRARYDAQRTVEAFAQRLRDEVDLDALAGEIQTVAATTMRPRHVSVWLPPAEPVR